MALKIFLLACVLLTIQLTHSVSLPTNYTWPLNSSKLCFAGRFDLAFNVKYPQDDGTWKTVAIPLDNSTFENYSVECPNLDANDTRHVLKIWMVKSLWNVILSFSLDNKNNETSLTEVSALVTIDDKTLFPKYDMSVKGPHSFSSNESMFEAPRDNSYRCNSKSSIGGFLIDKNVTLVSIDIENLHIQPFVDNMSPFSDYGVEKVCADDIAKSSNLVPIIVGICLAVLVVIVLVAYLVGRRRNRNGYQSV